jgi:hypothetical protein
MKPFITTLLLLASHLLASQEAQMDSIISEKPARPRNAFAHRGVVFNTAAPLEKGSLNWYNYYLLYNELEYAFTDRMSACLGFLIIPDGFGDTPFSLRLRHAIPVNERLSFAYNYQVFIDYSSYDGDSFVESLKNSDRLGASTLTTTYTSPQFVGSLSGGFGRNSYDKEGSPFVSIYGLWHPKRNGVLGLFTELNLGPTEPPRSNLDGLSTFGLQFRGKRFAAQLFGLYSSDGFFEEGLEVIPGFSFRTQIRKPKAKK